MPVVLRIQVAYQLMVSSRVVFIALVICCFFLYRNRRRDAREAKSARDWNDLHTWISIMFLRNSSECWVFERGPFYCTITGWWAIIPLFSAFFLLMGFLGAGTGTGLIGFGYVIVRCTCICFHVCDAFRCTWLTLDILIIYGSDSVRVLHHTTQQRLLCSMTTYPAYCHISNYK